MADLPTQTFEKSQRFAYLDVVRGLAASAVVATHVFELGFPTFRKATNLYCNLGLLGVLLFFIVSGTVITASIERAPSLKVFWLQRFWRLFPTYWVSLVIVASIFLLVPGDLNFALFVHIKERFWASFAANLTMLQGFLGFDHFIPAYWTLGFEMMFYFALSFFVVVRLGKHAHQILLAISAFLLFVGIYAYLKGAHLGSFKVILCGYFWMGIWVHRLLKGDVTPKLFWTALLVFQAAVFTTWYSNFNLYPAAASEAYAEFPFTPFAMLVGFFGATAAFVCLFQLRTIAFPKFLVMLGTVSYSLYLFHSIAMRIGDFAFDHNTSPVLYTLATIGLTILLTFLAYKFIEVPSLRKVKAVKMTSP
jgi:peptidoglycan/LPS O-acetylase OafA/YrhL